MVGRVPEMDGSPSRWSNLFDDLEGQLEHELIAEGVDLQAEEERLRLGRMSLRDRLDALRRSGAVVTFCFDDSRTLELRIAALGRDWLSGDIVGPTPARHQCILPLASVAGLVPPEDGVLESLGPPQDASPGLTARLGLSFVLRDLCRRRRPVDLVLATDELHGTIDRVGRDHLDLAVHAREVPRRQRAVMQVRLVPLDRLLFVRL